MERRRRFAKTSGSSLLTSSTAAAAASAAAVAVSEPQNPPAAVHGSSAGKNTYNTNVIQQDHAYLEYSVCLVSSQNVPRLRRYKTRWNACPGQTIDSTALLPQVGRDPNL